MEHEKESGTTGSQLVQSSFTEARHRQSELSPVRRIVDEEFESEEGRHPNPNCTNLPGRQRSTITSQRFETLNGWNADDSEMDNEFDDFKSNVYLRWLNCWNDFPGKA